MQKDLKYLKVSNIYKYSIAVLENFCSIFLVEILSLQAIMFFKKQ